MLDNCYTFKEIQNKFGWTTNEGSISKQIRYAKNRGVEIEFAFKNGKSYFRIISINGEIEDTWKIYPKNSRYEVSKQGKVRLVENKKLVGAEQKTGYIVVTDQTQTPTQYYRVHRMVMETFSPIENSEEFMVDHINGVKTDNRLENLRWVTARQNSFFRDENRIEINENLQKLITKRGYDWVNRLLLLELEEN